MSSAADSHPDLADEVVRLLIAMSERLGQHFASRADAVGLSAAEGKVLLALEPGEPISMRALAGKLSYDASNLTVVVDRLAGRAAVERKPHPSDRRVKTVELTSSGEQVRGQLSERLRADVAPLRALTEAQLRDMHALLSQALAGAGE